MDPLAGSTASVTIGLVGASVDAIPGLRQAGAELDVDVRRVDGDGCHSGDPSLVLCVGRAALGSLVDRQPSAPILPVGAASDVEPTDERPIAWDEAGGSVPSVSLNRAAEAVASLVAHGGETSRRPTLVVESDSTVAHALFDVALVTAEPGAIVTFAVRSNEEPITDVRADGIVVATAAGSRGFARAAGGPVLAPEMTAVTVVAIAPFAVDYAPWVGPPDGLELSIATDGPDAEVQCDGRVRHEIAAGSTLVIGAGPSLPIVTPHESRL